MRVFHCLQEQLRAASSPPSGVRSSPDRRGSSLSSPGPLFRFAESPALEKSLDDVSLQLFPSPKEGVDKRNPLEPEVLIQDWSQPLDAMPMDPPSGKGGRSVLSSSGKSRGASRGKPPLKEKETVSEASVETDAGAPGVPVGKSDKSDKKSSSKSNRKASKKKKPKSSDASVSRDVSSGSHASVMLVTPSAGSGSAASSASPGSGQEIQTSAI